MHEPMGVSGVQAVPNTLHSHGFLTPFRISPHWHAFGSAMRKPGTLNFNSASNAAYLRFEFHAAVRDRAKPAPLEVIARLEDLEECFERASVAVAVDAARILVFDFGATFDDLFDDHVNDCKMSSGSKPETTTGLPYSRAHEFVRTRTDNRADVAGADESRRVAGRANRAAL